MNFDGFFCLFSNILGMPRPGFGHTNITTAAALGMLGNSGEMCVGVRERGREMTTPPHVYTYIYLLTKFVGLHFLTGTRCPYLLYVGHDSLIFGTYEGAMSHIRECHVPHMNESCPTCLLHNWDVAPSYFGHDSLTYGTWHSRILGMTPSYVSRRTHLELPDMRHRGDAYFTALLCSAYV